MLKILHRLLYNKKNSFFPTQINSIDFYFDITVNKSSIFRKLRMSIKLILRFIRSLNNFFYNEIQDI